MKPSLSIGFRCQPRRRPKKQPVLSKKKLICLLFSPGPAIEAASLIIKKTVPFWHSFIRAPPLAKKTASLIGKETLKKRIPACHA
jgi:hypothetical protein